MIKYGILILICGYASLLTQMCISNFNDGARPVFPELMEKRMSRKEFGDTVTSMSIGWSLIGLCQYLGYGHFPYHLTLITTDCIGSKSKNKAVAFLLGACFGVALIGGSHLLYFGLEKNLAYDFSSDMTSDIIAVVMPILCLFPSLVLTSKKGYPLGVTCGILQGVIYWLFHYACFENPSFYSLLVGVCFLGICILQEKDDSAIENSLEEKELFERNYCRIHQNWILLCIQGGLNALGMATLVHIYIPGTLLASIENHCIAYYALISLVNILAFAPLFLSSSLSTGVYQNVGFMGPVLVGAFFIGSKYYPLSFIAGFIVEYLEILMLLPLNNFLNRHPFLSEWADSTRGAMAKCNSIALMIGCFLAAYHISGEIGLAVVAGFYLINEMGGSKIPTSGVGYLAVFVAGLLYNIGL